MKSLKWCFLSILLLILSCQKEEVSVNIVEGKLLELNLGDTVVLHVNYTPQDALLQDLKWKSSEEKVAWCHQSGKVFAWGLGSTDITAEALIDGEWVAATCRANVNEVMMTSLRLDTTTYHLHPGGRVTLVASYEPDNVSFSDLYWSSSDENIVTVSNGAVQAVGVGDCYVAVTNKSKSLADTCYISVSAIEMTSLALDKTTYEVEIGQQFSLTASFEPNDVTVPDLYWHSSDTRVATVSNGMVNAVGVGKCVISVTNADGSLTATCDVKVCPIVMTSLTLDKTACEVEIGQRISLIASYEPSNVTYQTLYWHSSDESVAKVSNGVVDAVGVGDCVISVTNADSSLTAKCDVKVYVIKMTSLTLSETTCEIPFGQGYELKATYEPSKVTYPALYWSSSDETVAKVVDGKIETVGCGSCVISVTNEEKTLTAQCEVAIYMQAITAISCLAEKTLECHKNFVLEATCEPAFISPGYDVLYWHSSDESIATVNRITGMVSTVGVGECTITIITPYSDATATCKLTVLPVPLEGISLNKTSLTLGENQTERLDLTFTPITATNKKVEWESSAPSVAKVDGNGKVTAVSEGEATIKVTALDGGYTAECLVKVVGAQYVKDYIEDKVSITITGHGMQFPGGEFYTYTLTNNGDEIVFVDNAEDFFHRHNADLYIDPYKSVELKMFCTYELKWTLELYGISHTKYRDDK